MKKFNLILLLILMTSTLFGCANKQNVNEINKGILTDEEKQLLNKEDVNSNIDTYSFKVDDTYKSIYFWIEIYENGELKFGDSSWVTQINSNEGKLALIVNKALNEWEISYIHDNGSKTSTFSLDTKYKKKDSFSIASGVITQLVQINEENEIILKTYLLEDGDAISAYDNQYYVEHPEVLKEYDYVYLLKCKFSKIIE